MPKATHLIRVASEADLADVARIHISSWQDAYRGVLPASILATRSLEGSLSGWQSTRKRYPNNLTVGFSHEGAILGFCCAGAVVDEARSAPFGFEIYGLHVDPERRQEGIGAALLRDALGRAKRMATNPSAIVWTLQDLQLSRRFYEREGGTLVKTGTWSLAGRSFPEVAYGWNFASFGAGDQPNIPT
jgi:ribosomal protein S18 acetylase RimI-like enzyme